MTNKDLIEIFAKENQLSIVAATKYFRTLFKIIAQQMNEKEVISIYGFGKFRVKVYDKEQRARNPKSGETIYVVKTPRVNFIASDVLKDTIENNSQKLKN